MPALTTNQNAGFVTVPSENKINYDILTIKSTYLIALLKIQQSNEASLFYCQNIITSTYNFESIFPIQTFINSDRSVVTQYLRMLHGERSHVFAAVSKRLLCNSVPPLVTSRSTFRSTFRLGEGKEKKKKKKRKTKTPLIVSLGRL